MQSDQTSGILRALSNGLVVRNVRDSDIEPLAQLEGEHMHFPMAFHIREWLRGDHPRSVSAGFTVVEDTKTGAIVSAACLLPQTLSYGGIPVRAGRAEAVVTHPEYRLRGLVRAQFEHLHVFADATSQSMQVVEGELEIYQKFGYELALDNFGGMNSGARAALPVNFAAVPDAAAEPFLLRSANPEDLRFVADLYTKSRSRYRLAVIELLSVWEYVLHGGEPDYNNWFDLRVITDRGGASVGFAVQDPWGAGRVFLYELSEHFRWRDVTPAVIRALDADGRRIAALEAGNFKGVRFCLSPNHPAYAETEDLIASDYDRHCEWGIRVPDLAAFLRQVAPALTWRLWLFRFSSHTGSLRINLRGSGLQVIIDNGKVIHVDNWLPKTDDDGDVFLPRRLFLPLLFGQRSIDELSLDSEFRPVSDETRNLLNCLFPKMDSHIAALA